MFGPITHMFRLARAGRVIARHKVIPEEHLGEMPAPARLAYKIGGMGNAPDTAGSPLASALTELGPTYIKLGQFLATRADIVGADRAIELSELQDKMAPFDHSLALKEIDLALGAPWTTMFSEISPPVAAASIAQVHKAKTTEGQEVAVKVLRPGIEAKFASELDSFFFAARLAERFSAEARRLRPVAAVQTLADSVKIEMDLRMEAAAISEMAQNTAEDPGFRVPSVDWTRTGRRVLTLEWIGGVPVSDVPAVKEAGHHLETLGDTVIQSFLRHAIRDGVFHADMHQGNLFVESDGTLVAVDYGIIGRLSPKDRMFLAEILYGFITRNYDRVSQVHFDAGYVPAHQDVATFSQALRSIGEPLMDRNADEISMAKLLGQLFQVTERFHMETQPQLLLLQKTMVVVEGVARTLNPKLNMWEAAEPVVRQWIEAKLGPEGRMQDAAEGALILGRVMGDLPEVLAEAGRTAHMLGEMASQGGLRLDAETTEALAAAQSKHNWPTRAALWLGAVALALIAVNLAW
ncbi:MAG: 2-polyprenylphenol 6-hydroxylase [Rhizobiales bacterium]|nr:2-polyprenylphenol 6-hydroxylase [Hyphomicrobiales bacterium]